MPPCNADVASENYADFIDLHSNLTLEELIRKHDTPCIDYVNQQYDIVYMPLEAMEPITVEKYTYTGIPKLYTLLDTSSMEASGITAVMNQPALALKGEGILIGIIDTGIEYQNPLFRNSDGTTRIVGIWDQTLPPLNQESADGTRDRESILYGRAFTQEEINQALASDDPLAAVPTQDHIGHGTFMAGIAAGGPSPREDFIGAAPLSSLCIVKLKPAKQYLRDFYRIQESADAYQENDIMMAMKYLLQASARLQMPMALYIGLGTNSGSHDGTSPLGIMIQSLSRALGLAIILPAGNEAGLRHHYLGQMVMNQEFEDVEIRVAPDERGFMLELWATEAELYTVGFISPTGEVIQRLPLNVGVRTQISFTLEETIINVNYRTTEIGSGSQLIVMQFINPTPGLWRVRVFNTLFLSGIYHMWLPVEGFISPDTIFLRSNPDTTITEPANSPFAITVSTYNHEGNSIYIHSSRGYSRSGQIKPNLAAPGVNVFGPALSQSGNSAQNQELAMTRKTGSCVAAAHVAGAVANLLEWGFVRENDTTMTSASINIYLIRGATRNPAFSPYPNREWGYGALNLFQTFLSLRE